MPKLNGCGNSDVIVQIALKNPVKYIKKKQRQILEEYKQAGY
jgi:hypothetical protein